MLIGYLSASIRATSPAPVDTNDFVGVPDGHPFAAKTLMGPLLWRVNSLVEADTTHLLEDLDASQPMSGRCGVRLDPTLGSRTHGSR
jgi:hypothetical protein